MKPCRPKSAPPISNSYSIPQEKHLATEHGQKYEELIQKVAYRYPDYGPAKERYGSHGSCWRNVKEVMGHGGHRVYYVDGLVRLYDEAKFPPSAGPLSFRQSWRSLNTPQFGPNRHDVSSYGRRMQRERSMINYDPSLSTQEYRNLYKY